MRVKMQLLIKYLTNLRHGLQTVKELSQHDKISSIKKGNLS